jgi:hypothetical protein
MTNTDHPDADPAYGDPDYERLAHLRNTVRENGPPLPWWKLRRMVKEENEVLKKWGC